MQHPDEGTIHAWLDGAIPEVEARAIEAHVTTCEQCASAVAEARGLMAASSRILSALDGVPGSVVPASSAIPVTRAGAAMAVTTYERRRRLGMYARIAAALAFVTAGGITLAHVGDQGLRPGDVRDAAAAVAATAAAATAAAPAVAATAVPSRESQSLQMEVTKPAPRAAAQAARRREKSAEAATASQRARVARDAAADAYAHVDSINRFGAERFLSEARVAPAPGAAPAASSAAPTSAQAANRAAEMKVAGMRPTALLDSADSVHGFSLVSGSVRTDPVRGVEHRRYEVRPGVFVSLEITPVRGTAVPDSAYRVGDTNVLRWTEGARQYVLSGPVTVAELRKMKESDAIR